MNDKRKIIMQKLDDLWIDYPAYLIDWLRDNKNKIKKHIRDINKFYNEIIDIIK